MSIKMPRGAIPSPRSELAASEPYRPDPGVDVFFPSGAIPSPNHEIAGAQPYRAATAAPESFLAWPAQMGFGGNEQAGIWSEEAFAKACAEPRIFIPADVVEATAQECGSSNFARFMQTHGFQMGRVAYLDGPFNTLDWTNTAALHHAIANAGPVKIGVASAPLTSGLHGQVTFGTSGWAIYGMPVSPQEDHWASLCGYGPLSALITLFERYGINVNVPPGMPAGLCYAMFTQDSIGIVDHPSLMNITGEAWVRNPATIVKNLDK